MTNTQDYRIALLPGFGRVRVPAYLSDQEVLDQISGSDVAATPEKKTKKKP